MRGGTVGEVLLSAQDMKFGGKKGIRAESDQVEATRNNLRVMQNNLQTGLGRTDILEDNVGDVINNETMVELRQVLSAKSVQKVGGYLR